MQRLAVSVLLCINVSSLRKIFSNYIIGRKGKRILNLPVGEHGSTVVFDVSVVLVISPVVTQMFEI